MNRRLIGIVALLLVVGFYAFGTGFEFFFRFLYVLLMVTVIGFVWAWLNLRGIDLSVTRDANRGRVGGYLSGQVSIINRTKMPKSWLEVAEATGPSADTSGRGLALIREQVRTWRIQTYLAKRGVYRSGQVRLISQDPFGLFRLCRDFSDLHHYIVFPAVEELPNLDARFAGLPSDSRTTRHWDQITTDVASIRSYVDGDSTRRIHWPYTARMNELMVKEFDMGLSAEAWVLLDMHQMSHYGADLDEVDNTEELSVTVAASIIERLMDQSMPVGLASNGDQEHIYRPDSSPGHGNDRRRRRHKRRGSQRSAADFHADRGFCDIPTRRSRQRYTGGDHLPGAGQSRPRRISDRHRLVHRESGQRFAGRYQRFHFCPAQYRRQHSGEHRRLIRRQQPAARRGRDAPR